MTGRSRVFAAPLFTFIVLTLFLSGCATPYKPVSLELAPVEENEHGERFFNLLIDHLANNREYVFARLFLKGEYYFRGVKLTDDGRQAVYLFEAEVPERLPHMPLVQYSYIYLGFGENPRLMAQENTSIGQGSTEDGDGIFKGTFKLTILNAKYCSGETKDLPVVEGNGVRIVQYDKVYSVHRGETQRKYSTPTYCQGFRVPLGRPELAGVRFYFEDKAEMDEFASALVAAYPFIEVVQPKTDKKTENQ